MSDGLNDGGKIENLIPKSSYCTDKCIDWSTVEVDGVDIYDYPDFCDAYAIAGQYYDGTELTEDELEDLSQELEWYDHVFQSVL